MKRNAASAALAFLSFSLIYLLLQMFLPFARAGGPVEVEVQRGMSLSEAVSVFKEEGLIRDEKLIKALGRVTGLQRRLTPGRYYFEGLLYQWRVYWALEMGRILPYEVTVVEGDSLREIGMKLVQEGLITEKQFAGLSISRKFLKGLGIRASSLEGYLYPDTYRFTMGDSPEFILGTMVQRLRQMYDDELRQGAVAMGMSEHKVLTLASIIEREAVLDSERPLISAVYHNRMKKRIPLQADPTAIYGIKPLSAGVTREDIKRKTPYNTYTFYGLPPGPIASPGIKSIRAALYPARVPYLYFVSNNDGSHTFSVTHREHMKAVRAYRAKKNNLKNGD
jgi:UPF0755 protein